MKGEWKAYQRLKNFVSQKKKLKNFAAVARSSFKLFLRCLPYQPREKKKQFLVFIESWMGYIAPNIFDIAGSVVIAKRKRTIEFK